METPTTTTVNVKIRQMHDQVSTYGLFLEANTLLCPKLRPGEVVALPDNHPIFGMAAMVHLEITHQEPNRPLFFESLADAQMQTMSPEKAVEAAGMIGTSLDISAKIRQDNLAAIERAKAEGTFVPEVAPNFAASDRQQGLGAVRNDNALPRGQETAETPQTAAQPIVETPDAGNDAPPSVSRRGRRTA